MEAEQLDRQIRFLQLLSGSLHRDSLLADRAVDLLKATRQKISEEIAAVRGV